ncbi:hypothetical protein PP940_gp055 [Rhizobium phage RL2RES]|uniref:Uncharacterized protein n=1 Tax=Rhizobium phage RL2RES TaxID=103371 RepID=A0A6B9J4D7_9CAUD|nr:hypothetical protein PP940_gp055 [Rhizobium phage RL2RES]QGZ14308.1 hypothetical protein RL2RES_055 [Rhizobium phage RL2RES]
MTAKTYKPDLTYVDTMKRAVDHLAKNENDAALEAANQAMNFALYKMMEPIDSYYVKQAKAIRNAVFTLRRYDRFMETA